MAAGRRITVRSSTCGGDRNAETLVNDPRRGVKCEPRVLDVRTSRAIRGEDVGVAPVRGPRRCRRAPRGRSSDRTPVDGLPSKSSSAGRHRSSIPTRWPARAGRQVRRRHITSDDDDIPPRRVSFDRDSRNIALELHPENGVGHTWWSDVREGARTRPLLTVHAQAPRTPSSCQSRTYLKNSCSARLTGWHTSASANRHESVFATTTCRRPRHRRDPARPRAHCQCRRLQPVCTGHGPLCSGPLSCHVSPDHPAYQLPVKVPHMTTRTLAQTGVALLTDYILRCCLRGCDPAALTSAAPGCASRMWLSCSLPTATCGVRVRQALRWSLLLHPSQHGVLLSYGSVAIRGHLPWSSYQGVQKFSAGSRSSWASFASAGVLFGAWCRPISQRRCVPRPEWRNDTNLSHHRIPCRRHVLGIVLARAISPVRRGCQPYFTGRRLSTARRAGHAIYCCKRAR